MARRQKPDHAWGRAFKKFCESRGVKLGRSGRKGPGRPKTGDKQVTLACLAAEVGVTERTAKRRLKAAREYETYDDTIRDGLDTGKLTAAQVRKEHPEPNSHTGSHSSAFCFSVATESRQSHWRLSEAIPAKQQIGSTCLG